MRVIEIILPCFLLQMTNPSIKLFTMLYSVFDFLGLFANMNFSMCIMSHFQCTENIERNSRSHKDSHLFPTLSHFNRFYFFIKSFFSSFSFAHCNGDLFTNKNEEKKIIFSFSYSCCHSTTNKRSIVKVLSSYHFHQTH